MVVENILVKSINNKKFNKDKASDALYYLCIVFLIVV